MKALTPNEHKRIEVIKAKLKMYIGAIKDAEKNGAEIGMNVKDLKKTFRNSRNLITWLSRRK